MSTEAPDTPSVLIVEDEMVVAADLENSLKRSGYRVTGIAGTGRQAVRLAEQSCPDLVLMDIQLKGPMDGVAAADEIHRRWQIPVVFVTANTNEETFARAKAAAPYGYLMKPFRIQELNATIRVALHQHRLSHKLFAEHNWLTTVLGSIHDGIVTTDVEGCLRYLNPVAEALTGWTRAEAMGKAIEEVYPLETLDGHPVEECQVRKAIALLAPVPKQRFLVKARDGRTIPVEDSAAPIVENGNVIGAVTVFRDITERLRAEGRQEQERNRLAEQVQQTSEELGHTQAELRALSAHLITAQEEERRRVARELHDDLGQRAALVEFEVHQLTELFPSLPPSAQHAIEKMRAHLEALSKGLRNVSHQLHPALITHLGLPAALRGLIEDMQQQGMEASLVVRDVPPRIPLDVATALYRIAQEALRNVARHAPEAPVQLLLLGEKNELCLHVKDAGPGFDLDQVRAKGGLGLLSMQERARLVNGSFFLRARPGEGTSLLVHIPCKTR